jgi:hypothetical protein
VRICEGEPRRGRSLSAVMAVPVEEAVAALATFSLEVSVNYMSLC